MKKEIKNNELIDMFNSGKNCSELAILYDCNAETIRLRLKKEGVNTSKKKCDIICPYCFGYSRKEGKTQYGKQKFLCLTCEKIFVSDIKEQKEDMIKLSTSEIGEKLGVSSTVPQRIHKKYGLTRNIGVAINTKLALKLGLSYDEYILSLPIYKKYKRKVWSITNKQKIDMLVNYEKRGLCGVVGAYQLDHKFSILEGFKNNVDAEIIGGIKNLEFITWEENREKGSSCSISLNDLTTIDIKVRVKN